VDYNLPLGSLFEGRSDILSFRVLANYLTKNDTYVVGATTITSQVGINGGGIIQGTGGNADWTSSLNVTYRNGPLTANLQERFVNAGRINANVDAEGNPYPANAQVNSNPTQNGFVPNTVPSYFYTDISASYRFGSAQNIEAFLTVNNLFDKAPPQEMGAFFGVGVVPSNYTLYDAIGRMFTLGARVRF